MQITINIDIEQIVRDAICNHVEKHLTIIHKPGETNVSMSQQFTVTAQVKTLDDSSETETPPFDTDDNTVLANPPYTSIYEYGPERGKRRTPAEIALHKKELEVGRPLTPEEKGQTKGKIEVDDNIEQKAKEEAINKDRIDKMAAEAKKAGDKELAEEAKENPVADPDVAPVKTNDMFPAESTTEPAIPKTDDLENINKLFA
jgi:hypothetical protein